MHHFNKTIPFLKTVQKHHLNALNQFNYPIKPVDEKTPLIKPLLETGLNYFLFKLNHFLAIKLLKASTGLNHFNQLV